MEISLHCVCMFVRRKGSGSSYVASFSFSEAVEASAAAAKKSYSLKERTWCADKFSEKSHNILAFQQFKFTFSPPTFPLFASTHTLDSARLLENVSASLFWLFASRENTITKNKQS